MRPLPHAAHRLVPPMTRARLQRLRAGRRTSETHFDPHRRPSVDRAG